MEVDPYAALAAPFAHHYDTLRGRVRLALVSEQLDDVIEGPAAILDVGGGAGHQALRLARRGHLVTLLDPSMEMLDRASAALDPEPREVVDRVTLVHGAASEAATLLPGRRFDVVCCHAGSSDSSGVGGECGELGPVGLAGVEQHADAPVHEVAQAERDALDAFREAVRGYLERSPASGL